MFKKDLIRIYKALNSMGNLTGTKFVYGVSKNINILKPEIESLEKAITLSKEFGIYDDARVELAKEYAKKDEKGVALTNKTMKDGKVISEEYILDNKEAFEKALKKLQKENQEVISTREKQVEDYLKMLDEEVSIAFFPYMIAFEDLPTNLTAQQMNGIAELVNEPKA